MQMARGICHARKNRLPRRHGSEMVLLKKQPPKQVHLKKQPLLMDPHKGLDLLPLPK